ncbi:hypothetical protein CDEF62S_02419 [Castellaniella defragrans]
MTAKAYGARIGKPVPNTECTAAAQQRGKAMDDIHPQQGLTPQQQSIASIAAFAATGDLPRLGAALREGLDAGLTVSECSEVLVQSYAYVGFPRSLNALGELMKVLDERQQRGIQDDPGRQASPLPSGYDALTVGAANQTRLAGGPVKGAVLDFVPAIDRFLKAHLFGDIFARDTLDWVSRELATVGMLSSMPGVESQLQAHMRISMNVGLTAGQLRQLCQVLADRVGADAARRAREALERQLAAASGR